MPVMSRGITGIEFDGPPELALCAGPVPVECKLGPRQRAVYFSELVIQFERLHRCRLGGLQRFSGGQRAEQVSTQQAIAVGDSGVRQRVLRIQVNRLMEVFNPLSQTGFGPLVPVKSAVQVKLIS